MSKADNKELEEAIKTLYPLSIGDFITWFTTDGVVKVEVAIETVLKELKRLQEDYIEKDKIREKLQELEKEYKEALEENSTKAFILKCQIEILEELLEGK